LTCAGDKHASRQAEILWMCLERMPHVSERIAIAGTLKWQFGCGLGILHQFRALGR
jgi:hypothetical protein